MIISIGQGRANSILGLPREIDLLDSEPWNLYAKMVRAKFKDEHPFGECSVTQSKRPWGGRDRPLASLRWSWASYDPVDATRSRLGHRSCARWQDRGLFTAKSWSPGAPHADQVMLAAASRASFFSAHPLHWYELVVEPKSGLNASWLRGRDDRCIADNRIPTFSFPLPLTLF